MMKVPILCQKPDQKGRFRQFFIKFKCKQYRLISFTRISIAIVAVQNGMSIRNAASKYLVAASTLQYHRKHSESSTKRGRHTALTDEEEQTIVDWIAGCTSRGAPRTSLDILDAANKIIRRRQVADLQKTDLGRGWLEKFSKRQNLALRVPDKLSKASANLSEQNIRNWFATISLYIYNQPDYLEAICDGQRVVNADESMIRLNSSSSRVLVPVGTKHVYEVTTNEKFGLTVMASFKANGTAFKPFIIYPQERISHNLDLNFPHDRAFIAATKSGWMDTTTFCLYLKALSEEAQEEGIKFPLILFLDNHLSHTSLESTETAEKLGIKMIFLYPNSTFILQPADVAIFRCLKSLWRKKNREGKENEIVITKNNFAGLFVEAFSKIPADVIKNGFNKTGLYPLNSDNVDYTKCLGKNTSASVPAQSTSVPAQSPSTSAHFTSVPAQSTSASVFQYSISLEDYVEALQEPFVIEPFSSTLRSYEHIFEDFDSTIHTVENMGDLNFEPPQEGEECEKILRLPPTPQRMGKRRVKRTHPVAEENIAAMKIKKTEKAQQEQAKQARKIARDEKKKRSVAIQLEKAIARRGKDDEKISRLTQMM